MLYGLIYLASWLPQAVGPASVTMQPWLPFTALFAYCPDTVDRGADNLATSAAILMVSDGWYFCRD